MSLLPNELVSLVIHGREERNLEYKAALDWNDKRARGRLVKTILAMSNLRDGGAVVIGVADDGAAVGISSVDALGLGHDLISAEVANYAAPYAELTVSCGQIDEGSDKTFVVIEVRQFQLAPIICRSDGPECRQGAIYVRSRRMIETSEVRTEAEMRELLDLAIDNGVRNFERRAQIAGLSSARRASDADSFRAQLGDL